ncbi:MAG TPA: phage major capsid protein [Nocardioidaceae bacterium]|jgi:HK97 family phage major capsid protein|nr:phage major capsid protein [Nocardioidaceae bacterium]
MGAIRSDLDALLGVEEQTDEHALRFEALTQEWDELDTELKPLAEREAKIAEIRERAAAETNRETTRSTPDLVVKNDLDPYADMDSVRTGMVQPGDLRSRALKAVERYAERSDHWQLQHDGAEQATRMVEKLGPKFGTAVARHILTTSTPEYLAAFQQYMEEPTGFSQRAAMSLTAANGGYLVPFTLDPTIILTNNASANPYRRYATIKTTATNDWNGVTSAGVTAEWTAEGIEAADASPTVGQLKITPQKADAYLFGSYEVIGDSDIGQQLPELLSDAKDRLEESAFAVGTGTGQPWGVMARGTTLAAASGTAATGPTAASVYSLVAALPARWRGPGARLVWLSNLTAINTLRNTAKFSGATESIVTENTAGDAIDPVMPARMLGIPYLESTSVVGAYANGNKVLAIGDMRQYYIVDRIGMSVVYDPLVLGSNRRPTGQGAWYAFWRVGADLSTAGAFRVLTLTT